MHRLLAVLAALALLLTACSDDDDGSAADPAPAPAAADGATDDGSGADVDDEADDDSGDEDDGADDDGGDADDGGDDAPSGPPASTRLILGSSAGTMNVSYECGADGTTVRFELSGGEAGTTIDVTAGGVDGVLEVGDDGSGTVDVLVDQAGELEVEVFFSSAVQTGRLFGCG